jgi:hypothetical protein
MAGKKINDPSNTAITNILTTDIIPLGRAGNFLPLVISSDNLLKPARDYADGKVADAINDGITTIAPSQDAVFNALAGKEPTITAGTAGQYYGGDKTFQTLNAAAVAGLAASATTDTTTTANITDSTNKRFVTDVQQTVISNASGTNTGDETTATIQAKRPLKMVNSQSIEGSGNINIGGGTWGGITGTLSDQTDLQNALNAAGGSSALNKLEGISQPVYSSFIDIPLDLDNYESQILKTSDLLNDTTGIRLRFRLLDINNNPINYYTYFWSGGYIVNSQNQSTTEYGNTSSYGSLTGERLPIENGQSALISSSVGNTVSRLNIELSKLSNGSISVQSDFQYTDTNLYVTSGFVKNLYKFTGPTEIVNNVSGIRVFASSGNIKGSLNKYGLVKSTIPPVIPPVTQSVIASIVTIQSLVVTQTANVANIPEYPIY